VEALQTTLDWIICLSLGCLSLPMATREQLVWRHFLRRAGIPAEEDTLLPPPPLLRTTVALVVRTYAGALSELLPLLRSVELFWPYQRWPVVLILDAESTGDWWVASAMVPRWVRVAFEPEPPHFKRWVEVVHDGSKGRGWQRAAWSQFNFDRYVQADFIAQIDADTVINTWVDEELLFDTEGRPRITGATQWLYYKYVVRALGLQDDIEFMASQPMVIRHEHFEATRRFITRKMRAADFNEAFSLLTHAVMKNATPGKDATIHHLPCHQSATGGYLWQFHREEYSWHVMWRGYDSGRETRRWKTDSGRPESKPPDFHHQCAQLYVGSHLGSWANQNIKGYVPGRDPVPFQGGQRYLMMSAEVLLVQLCAARQALLRLHGPQASALADQLVAPPRGHDPGWQANWTGPEQLCQSVVARTQASSVMLGLSSIAFWRNDKPPEYCTPVGMLLEEWERHAARSALDFLRARGAA